MEGWDFATKKGIRPYDEGLSDLTNDNMVEGFSWDTVQILNDNQILSLKKYVQDNQLNIDVKSLEEGNGVLRSLTSVKKTET